MAVSVQVTYRNFVYQVSFNLANTGSPYATPHVVCLHSTGGPEGGHSVVEGCEEWEAVFAMASLVYNAECAAFCENVGGDLCRALIDGELNKWTAIHTATIEDANAPKPWVS